MGFIAAEWPEGFSKILVMAMTALFMYMEGQKSRYDDELGFEEINLTHDEAWLLCRTAVGIEAANYKMSVATTSPGRFDEVIEEIRQQDGGESVVEELLKRTASDAVVS